MIKLKGKYNLAKVFNNNVETQAISQILELLNQAFLADSKIRIMPDVHAGKGCVIGTTMTLTNKMVVPNLVGVDIGCGMEWIKIKETSRQINLASIDDFIRKNIPSGMEVRNLSHKFLNKVEIEDLKCKDKLTGFKRLELSLGSLGGGNHFIEMNEDSEGSIYLVVHSGSRNLGKQVAEIYQKKAYSILNDFSKERKEIIEACKREKRQQNISKELEKLKKEIKFSNRDLAYVYDTNFDDYVYDMKITQEFALWNRKAIIQNIVEKLNFHVLGQYTTIHNYIDTKSMILRKGAISAQKDEVVLIPMNMRDGSLIAIGKGNEDWNFSAPHGAGRLMSRGKAKDSIDMKDYKKSMEGIFTSCVNKSTIDESPFAYKPMDEIISNIEDTVEVKDTIKPIYNFKAN